MTRDRVSDVGSPSLMAHHYQGHRERLRERFREAGAAALSDYELLELALYAGIPRRDVKPLAKQLLGAFGSFADVLASSPEKLSEFLGESAIVQLKIVEAAAMRLARTRLIGRPALSSWAALLDYCSAAMARSETEEFRVLFLDRKKCARCR